jgi:chromosome partitioning protein
MVIVVGGIKGGSGKTTVVTNLAVMRAAAGRDVLVIDTDRQGTAMDFFTLRDSTRAGAARYRTVQLLGRAFHEDASRVIRTADDVFVDTDGQDSETQKRASALAHVLLVPFVPRSFDFWTLDRVVSRVRETRTVNPRLRACAFLNRVDARRGANDDADEVLGESGVLEVLPARLGSRKAFGLAASEGLAVTELHPLDKKASEEITALYESVFSGDANSR